MKTTPNSGMHTIKSLFIREGHLGMTLWLLSPLRTPAVKALATQEE